ncbi:SulP family inorganic anion transporter [Lyngbya sp. CCY1209]|uniref:SLC26A/SulP transporter family protein n=1 Tax=Lyngbya sp. CCY1209 TaxID=2886103 RepID=UPI002D20E6FA|nr:SulP family inorganic anion transporter [Lyngbya sp. CCY1209]MEB3885615.1 STAS domain-containing protein [Lyngbya sp. CCY1209]
MRYKLIGNFLSHDFQLSDRINALLRELHPRRLIPSLVAGTIAGVIEVSFALSLIALVFSGDLSGGLWEGVAMALVTIAVLSSWIALTGSARGVVSGLQEGPMAIWAGLAAAIAEGMSPEATDRQVIATVMAAMGCAALLSGGACWLSGYLKLGHLIRAIPYPVVGGFLAGTGWLLLIGSVGMMADLPLTRSNWLRLFAPDVLWHWLSGVIFALILFGISRRYRHWAAAPLGILAGVALFYLLWGATGLPWEEAQARGWLPAGLPEGALWRGFDPVRLSAVRWSAIAVQAGPLAAVALFVVVGSLLNAVGIELAVREDIDLDRELRAVGTANLISGLGGGLVGYQSLSLSLLSHQLGVKRRSVGVFAAAVAVAVLVWGAPLLSAFPKPILGGLSAFLGVSLLVTWVWDIRRQLGLMDYFSLLSIWVAIAAVGFWEGIVVGLGIAVVLFALNCSRISPVREWQAGAIASSHKLRPAYQRQILRHNDGQLEILLLQGFLFFGTANSLIEQVCSRICDPRRPPLRFLILDFGRVAGIDSSAAFGFAKIRQVARRHQIILVLVHLSPDIERQLRRANVLAEGDLSCRVFPDRDRGTEWCEERILNTGLWKYRRWICCWEKLHTRRLDVELAKILGGSKSLDAFKGYLELLHLGESAAVFRQGDPHCGLYFIRWGQVSIWVDPPNRPPLRLWTLGNGSIFGKTGLSPTATRLSTAIADRPSALYRLSPAALARMKEKDPQLAVALEHHVLMLLCEEHLRERERGLGE